MLSESTPGRASCALPAAGTGILSAITRFISQRAFDTGTAALRQRGAAATGARSVRAPATARDDNETAATALPWSQAVRAPRHRSEEHTSELQSLTISYAVFCCKKK